MGSSFNPISYFSRLNNCVLASTMSNRFSCNHNYEIYKLFKEGIAIDIFTEARKLGKNLAKESNQTRVSGAISDLYLSKNEIAASNLFSAVREIAEIDAYAPDRHVLDKKFIDFIYEISNVVIKHFKKHCFSIPQFQMKVMKLLNTKANFKEDKESSTEQ